jgi:predicted ATPase
VVVSAVAGLAGVGKTALAVQAAHAAREAGWFAGGVLFIDLHGVGPGRVL